MWVSEVTPRSWPISTRTPSKYLAIVEEPVEIESGVIRRTDQRRHHHLGSRLGVAEGERHGGRVDHVDAGLDGLQVRHRGEPTDVVTVELDGDADLGLEAPDELLSVVWREECRHVLDADGIGAHVDQPVGDFEVVIERVHRRNRVHHRTLEMLPGLLDRRGGRLEVADVVERVEHSEDVHPVLGRLVHEAADDIVAVVTVADDVLAAQQHLQGRAHDMLLDQAQTLPRVLVEEAQGGVEGRASPALERVVADLVHLLEDGEHLVGAHARRPQRLVAVAQRCIGDLYLTGAHRVLLSPTRRQARLRYSLVRVSTLTR